MTNELAIVVSGMLRLGIAFGAMPFLGFFTADLVHQGQA